jgi:hypothetical protein
MLIYAIATVFSGVVGLACLHGSINESKTSTRTYALLAGCVLLGMSLTCAAKFLQIAIRG